MQNEETNKRELLAVNFLEIKQPNCDSIKATTTIIYWYVLEK
jgi:hypothetical protein